MGHSKADKAETHERVVALAAGLFRELGVDGISVADLMQAAGLTQGGFYRHFASRDALVAEAVERALADGGAAADAIAANPQSSIGTLIDAYLSPWHRDHVALGCAVTALATDVSRSDVRVQAAYARQVQRYVDLIAGLTGHLPKKKRRAFALEALATMVGAVSMARAVDDAALSAEILTTAATALKARLLSAP